MSVPNNDEKEKSISVGFSLRSASKVFNIDALVMNSLMSSLLGSDLADVSAKSPSSHLSLLLSVFTDFALTIVTSDPVFFGPLATLGQTCDM